MFILAIYIQELKYIRKIKGRSRLYKACDDVSDDTRTILSEGYQMGGIRPRGPRLYWLM